MNTLKKLPVFFSLLLLFSCDEFPLSRLSDSENAAGLKSALEVGAKYALNTLGKEDGFLLDQAVKILLPPDAANLINFAKTNPILAIPLGNAAKILEEQLILTINRAAEIAIDEVIPIVVNAITDMSIQDATSILFAKNDRAATNYLIEKTFEPLSDVCYSVIEGALNKEIVPNLSAQKVWGGLTGLYNDIVWLLPYAPVQRVETDLAIYTTEKALDAVFLKVGDEEVKIRTDVSARVSDLLKRVFGQLD